MKQETLEEAKDLNYWKNNAEEDYLKVPISVLRYITELEKKQERSYSEEEVLSFCEWFAFELNHYGYPTNKEILKALEQLKNK